MEDDLEIKERKIVIYDKTGKKIDGIDIEGKYLQGSFIAGDDKYMFLRGRNEEGAYILYADKNKIGTEKIEWKILFEIESKYLDIGVRG